MSNHKLARAQSANLVISIYSHTLIVVLLVEEVLVDKLILSHLSYSNALEATASTIKCLETRENLRMKKHTCMEWVTMIAKEGSLKGETTAWTGTVWREH